MMRWLWILIVLGLLASAGCSEPPAADEFQVGQTQEDVLAQFGEPQSRKTLTKNTDYIFGPIESFWSTVEQGTEIEIWYYPVEGGTVELYFVQEADTVQGIGFAPEGAVY